jgi:FdhE protein
VIAEFQPSTHEVLQALENQRLNLPSLLDGMAVGHLEAIEPAAETAEVSPVLLRMLLEYTLRPTLRAWAEQIQGLISLEHWQQTRCPVCDNPPLLSEIRGSTRARYLRCGICGAAWPYPRLQCALCANADPRTQSILCEDGEEHKIYAHTCRGCMGYIKCFYTAEALLVDLLPVEDLVTLYLDQGCQERGYSRSPAH